MNEMTRSSGHRIRNSNPGGLRPPTPPPPQACTDVSAKSNLSRINVYFVTKMVMKIFFLCLKLVSATGANAHSAMPRQE